MSRDDSLFADLQSFVPRKYFSSSGRSKHTVDIYNDPSRLFPNYLDSENSVNKTLAAYAGRYLNHLSQKEAERAGPDGYKSLALPDIDKSSINTPQQKSSSPFREITKKHQENIQKLTGRMKRPMRQQQMVFGKKLVERADDLLSSLRSPKDIYTQNYQVMKKIDGRGDAQRFGKEDIRKMAKRYDVTINLEEEGEFRKQTHFMREVPMEYYRKLKETINARNSSNKGTSRTSRADSKAARGSDGILDISLTSSQRPAAHYVPPISLKNSTISESEVNTPAHPSQRTKIKTKRSGSTALDMANREKSLFLSPLAKALELNRFSSSFNQGYQPEPAKKLRTSQDCDEEEQEETPRVKTKREIQKEQRVWMSMTNDIQQGITEYLSDKTLGKSYIEHCQDKVQKDVKKLEMATEGNDTDEILEEGEEEEVDDGIDKMDLDEMRKDLSNKPVVNNKAILKAKGKSSNGNFDAKSFYKFLIYKEQRKAESTLAGIRNAKPKLSSYAGRELFPRIGDD